MMRPRADWLPLYHQINYPDRQISCGNEEHSAFKKRLVLIGHKTQFASTLDNWSVPPCLYLLRAWRLHLPRSIIPLQYLQLLLPVICMLVGQGWRLRYYNRASQSYEGSHSNNQVATLSKRAGLHSSFKKYTSVTAMNRDWECKNTYWQAKCKIQECSLDPNDSAAGWSVSNFQPTNSADTSNRVSSDTSAVGRSLSSAIKWNNPPRKV